MQYQCKLKMLNNILSFLPSTSIQKHFLQNIDTIPKPMNINWNFSDGDIPLFTINVPNTSIEQLHANPYPHFLILIATSPPLSNGSTVNTPHTQFPCKNQWMRGTRDPSCVVPWHVAYHKVVTFVARLPRGALILPAIRVRMEPGT